MNQCIALHSTEISWHSSFQWSVCAITVFSAFMSSLQLDSSLVVTPEPQKLPQALIEKCAAISVRPDAIKDLIDAMQCMKSFSSILQIGCDNY